MEGITVSKLVKSEDLNHHETLFAGRIVEWFVESSFICAAKVLKQSDSLVCAGISDFAIRKPVKAGDVLDFECTISKAGRTSLTVLAKGRSGLSGSEICEGHAVFVNLDHDGKPSPHGVVLAIP